MILIFDFQLSRETWAWLGQLKFKKKNFDPSKSRSNIHLKVKLPNMADGHNKSLLAYHNQSTEDK